MQKTVQNLIAIIILALLLIALFYFVADYQRRKVAIEKKEGMPPEEVALPPEEIPPFKIELKESPLGMFNPEEPELTLPLKKVPRGAISIKVSKGEYKPSEFTVKSGDVISLVLTGIDGSHGLRFEAKELEKVKIFVAKDESRGISFIAPKSGDYIFYCDMPGHREAGEEGVMHIK